MRCQKAFDHIKDLLITQPELCILTLTIKFRFKSDKSKQTSVAALFQFQQDH